MNELSAHGLRLINKSHTVDPNTILISARVFPDNPVISFRIKNKFIVEWGDGAKTSHGSNILVSHKYDFQYIDPVRGRNINILIYSKKSYNITNVDLDPLNDKNDIINRNSSVYVVGIKANLPNLKNFNLSSNVVLNRHPKLDRILITN